MIIYRATNLTNDMSYIGQTIKSLRKRKLQHFCENKNTHFKNALDYYGDDNFVWEILEHCDTKEELDEMEFHYIKQYNTKSPNGYNLTDGGDYGTFGWEPTEETKNSISNSLKDKWENDLEFRDRMTNKLKEIDNSGENNPMKGVKRPDKAGENNPSKRPEVKKKISENKIGSKHTKETRQKISENSWTHGKSWEEIHGEEKAKEMRQNASERGKQKKGKKASDESKEKLRKSKSKYLYKAISPEGEEYEFTSLNKFSDDMGFCRAGPKYHLRNNSDNYKGWKFYIIDTLDNINNEE